MAEVWSVDENGKVLVTKTQTLEEYTSGKQVKEATPQAAGFVNTAPYGYNRVFPIFFDGEKDLGEMGNIRQYIIDHSALRLRSKQLFIDSDVCQAIFNRSAMWGIGNGLKLQASPKVEVTGATFDAEKFNDEIEALFGIWANDTQCDYSEQRTLGEITTEAWINKDISGDVLLVMRLIDGVPKVQVIDGSRVQTPMLWGSVTGLEIINPTTKNRVRHGVEIDDRGRHVAYFVFDGSDTNTIESYQRIEARMTQFPYSEMARMVYGMKYTIDSARGIPLITAVMETAAKMGRYREAVVGTAEEQRKIVYQVTHGKLSDGLPPTLQQITEAAGFGNPGLPTDSNGEALANKIAATTNKMTFNMSPDSKIEPINGGDGELLFRDFYEINWDLVCAVAGYPPEVIMSKYNSNYSSSRAAIKDFEHTLIVKRGQFSPQANQMIYNFCLDVWVLQGRVVLPGYIEALNARDSMRLAAYRRARWVGDNVPHIDPYKEVQAVRAMLGKDSENFPLTTMEQAIEMLSKGDFNSIIEQYANEIKKGESLDIERVEEKETEMVAPNGNPRKKEGEDE